MLTVTKKQLHVFLQSAECEDYDTFDAWKDSCWVNDDDGPPFDAAIFAGLKACDLKKIVADSEMSEHHLGGDDLVAAVDDALWAIDDGYQLVTWYGPKTEALVAGYREDELTIRD